MNALDPDADTASLVIFSEGPKAGGTMHISGVEWNVGQYAPIRDESGLGLGAYRVDHVGDGLAGTTWIEGWPAFLEDLHRAEREFEEARRRKI